MGSDEDFVAILDPCWLKLRGTTMAWRVDVRSCLRPSAGFALDMGSGLTSCATAVFSC